MLSILQVFIGRALVFELGRLQYFNNTATPPRIPLEIIVPAVVVPVAVILLCCVVWLCVISQPTNKKRFSADHEIREVQLTLPIDGNKISEYCIWLLYSVYTLKRIFTDNMVVEELVKTLPARLIISASEVRILDIPLGQGINICTYMIVFLDPIMHSANVGQFGMVYKGHLIKHQHMNTAHTQEVAVKILKSS